MEESQSEDEDTGDDENGAKFGKQSPQKSFISSAVHQKIIAANAKEEQKQRQFKRFAEGEAKVEWQLADMTEVCVGDSNPIYLKTF